MKYDFMRSHANEFWLSGMFRVLSASRSGNYGWCRRGVSARQRDDFALAVHLRRIHNASRGLWCQESLEGLGRRRHR
jgi:putative transposase